MIQRPRIAGAAHTCQEEGGVDEMSIPARELGEWVGGAAGLVSDLSPFVPAGKGSGGVAISLECPISL